MFDQGRLDRIANWMQGYVDTRKFPGCSVLIDGQGAEQYFHATGQRDIATGAPFTRDTVVRMYSMTKPVTSTVFGMLLAEGRIHLEARLSDFIPAFAQTKALHAGALSLAESDECPSPTMQQLLTHTSGLSYAFNPGVVPQEMEEREIFFAPAQGTLEAHVAKLAELPLAFVPGTRWEYSVGIDVIGRVIEILEGKPLDRVFQERIFDPLGMTETSFVVPDAWVDRFACLYTPLAGNAMGLNSAEMGEDTLRQVDDAAHSQLRHTTLFSGGGGLVGTLDDFSTFARFLRTGLADGQQLLSPSLLRFMHTNHLGTDIASMGAKSFAEQPHERNGLWHWRRGRAGCGAGGRSGKSGRFQLGRHGLDLLLERSGERHERGVPNAIVAVVELSQSGSAQSPRSWSAFVTDTYETLFNLLSPEALEVDLFRGTGAGGETPMRIFGGQVIGQALASAYATVEDRLCHSLHAYFIRPGDPKSPVIYQVDRSRDGGSFTTRRVVAIQQGRQILNMSASFHADEEGWDHQRPMPEAPAPDALKSVAERRKEVADRIPEKYRDEFLRALPIEIREVEPRDMFAPEATDDRNRVWFRMAAAQDCSAKMQHCLLAYASDMHLLGSSLRRHGLSWLTGDVMSASLDHAIWFHGPATFQDWHLYTMESTWTGKARGFNRGMIYAQDGRLVASVAQEGLLRPIKRG